MNEMELTLTKILQTGCEKRREIVYNHISQCFNAASKTVSKPYKANVDQILS